MPVAVIQPICLQRKAMGERDPYFQTSKWPANLEKKIIDNLDRY